LENLSNEELLRIEYGSQADVFVSDIIWLRNNFGEDFFFCGAIIERAAVYEFVKH
jgi:hypothetical protein